MNQETIEAKRPRSKFSIKSALILTTVFSATAASLGHLWQATNGDDISIGRFVIITSMLPLVILAFASCFFRISNWIFKQFQ